MYCTNCGQELSENASVCTSCGVLVGQERKFCSNCGEAVHSNQSICLKCGSALQPLRGQQQGVNVGGGKMIAPSGKSAGTATLLSCLIVGLGQIYLGQVLKGIVMILLCIVTGGAAALPLWIVGMIDANKIGKKLEAGQSVGEWEFF